MQNAMGATAGLPSSALRRHCLAACARASRSVLAGTFLLLALGPTAQCRAADDKGEGRIAEIFGDWEPKQDWRPAIRTPTRVEAFRIDPKSDPTAVAPAISGYSTVGSAIAVDEKIQRELSSLLLDPKTYPDRGPSYCGFAPGIAVRFTNKDSRVILLFCFDCDDVQVGAMGAPGGSKRMSFSPGRAGLVNVMKKIFPNDKTVQGLKEKREEKKKKDDDPDALIKKIFGNSIGDDWRPTLRTPTKVEAFRVESTADPSCTETFSGYPIIGSAIVLDEKLQKEVSSVLLDPKTYAEGSLSACGFAPGIAIRFTGKETRVVVLLCFHCEDILVTGKGFKDENMEGFIRRAELVRLMKKIFPKDKVVQGLKEVPDPKDDPTETE